MKKNTFPIARRSDIVTQEAGDEVLVYDLTTNKASCLNDTAAFVWQNCDGKNSISDIAAALSRKTNSAFIDEFMWLAIDELSQHDLLATPIQPVLAVTGLSRRDMIKKVGLGAIIALPIVAKIVAPPAAYSASFCGSTCNGNGNCTGTVCTTCSGPVGAKTCV